MIATVILALVIFSAFFYVIYSRFLKKGSSGCHDCEDVGCPLVDTRKIKEHH
ncbi:MAG: FeoB-associated Cys-rich membrane protein [Liquorilactobacillus hordei]|uniref:FeoB-associated Cys-rich membrane protein n=1 Tax=Liquorilactobacillus hordei TaxID=468911 RepID=UPI0039EA7C0A